MNEPGQAELGWTVVLRRQPVRIVAGQVEGGYTDAYELVCCECGDHPDPDYRVVSLVLRQTAGPIHSWRASRRTRATSRVTKGQATTIRAAWRDRSAAHPPG